MLRYFVIDAFTDTAYRGNPAAVVWLPDGMSLSDAARLQIAREFKLSETAFVQPLAGDEFNLRWFTPTTEVELCGHATLATCRALSEWREWPFAAPAQFRTWRKGTLRGTQVGAKFVLDFPQIKSRAVPIPELAHSAFAADSGLVEAHDSKHSLVLVLKAEASLTTLAPNHDLIAKLHPYGVSVTAQTALPGVDFVSRFFAPNCGINEDPVCGSAHCVLAPLWATRLNKAELCARQLSPRGGSLHIRCEKNQKRLEISGDTAITFSGMLRLPAGAGVVAAPAPLASPGAKSL